MFSGCYTALITPFSEIGAINWKGLDQLIEFQIQQGVSGILATGTTAESPTLNWEEHERIIEEVYKSIVGSCELIAGTGSNSTEETYAATSRAVMVGVDAILLVDPYYNGPSSLEIRREYVAPVAKAFPGMPIIPYIIPGRTGTQLLPEDLAILHDMFSNVCAVKEATGDFDNMKRTRKLCGYGFDILSGDDDKTWTMMRDSAINASGVISVVSNVAPRAVQLFVQAMLDKNFDEAARLENALKPLFEIVTVKTTEQTQYGPVACRARNPLAIKTLMNILGMPSGPCRQPLGKMTREGCHTVLGKACMVWEKNPEILTPIEKFFRVNIDKRLEDAECCRNLYYDFY
jgi:4-hydroxy-tetrahydrodipicolinate synthase